MTEITARRAPRRAMERPSTPIVTTKRSRRSTVWGKGKAAAEVLRAPVQEGTAQPSTPRAAERVPATPANDDRKPAIVTTTSRKRTKLLRAEKRAMDTDGDPEMRAWLLRAMQGRWPRDD
jgi:hypothetical protein